MSTIIPGTAHIFQGYNPVGSATLASEKLQGTPTGGTVETVGASVTGDITRNGGTITISNIKLVFPKNPFPTVSSNLYRQNHITSASLSAGGGTSTLATQGDFYLYPTPSDVTLGVAMKSYDSQTPPNDISFPDLTFTSTSSSVTLSWSFTTALSNDHTVNNTVTGSVSLALPPYYAFYGSVNGQTERVVKMYGPIYYITNIANQLSPVNYTTFNAKYSAAADVTKQPVSLNYIGGRYTVTYSDGTNAPLGLTTMNWDQWGFMDSPEAGAITAETRTKKINKLYGSVNGQTKLIYSA